jgi:DNA polymerase III subunit epsilon
MNHRPLVFIDIETTGATPYNSRVLEVGAIRVENNKIVREIKQLINPEEYVPGWITKLTGITNEAVWDKPIFRDVADDLETIFEDAIFIAHNVSFDYGFIKQEFKKLGVVFNKDRLCTVRLSRALYPAQKSHRLDAVIQAHGYSVENRHRAYDDAEVLYKFYRDHLALHGQDLYRVMNKLLQVAPNPGSSGVGVLQNNQKIV